MEYFSKIWDGSCAKKGSVEMVNTNSSFHQVNFEDYVASDVAGSNFMTMFRKIPEVFFPINYIASRIAQAKFSLNKIKDDSVVWDNKQINQILNSPNCLMNWREFVYAHHVYKLCTGNSFIRAAMGDFTNVQRWRFCNNFWVLPSEMVKINNATYNVPLYGMASIEDIIKSYYIESASSRIEVPTNQIWHDRDGLVNTRINELFSKGQSRLNAQKKPIANLLAVYEARNVIYVKRGGLGFIISEKKDATGTVSLNKNEKDSLVSQHNDTYGINGGKMPYGISDVPISFVRTNMSISFFLQAEDGIRDF